MDFLILNETVASTWQRFLNGRRESLSRNSLSRELLQRWERVRALGVDPDGPEEVESIATPQQIRERREELDRLLVEGEEILETTAAAFSARHFLLLLADRDGMVITTLGGGEFADHARNVRLIEGAQWAEEIRGTNAIGTALAEKRPVVVSGYAHYERVNHSLICYSCPIRNPDGEVVAVLDATSFQSPLDPLAKYSISGAARAIEESWYQAVRQPSDPPRRPIYTGLPAPKKDPFGRLFGTDPALEKAKERSAKFARSSLPVLLLAETGTGKNLLAEAIHRAIDRSDGPFVSVNCGALTPSLLESELFGYGPGAFTGASPEGRKGRVAAAHQGTLFLDEVGEMSPSLQALLLRVLEDGSFNRVGELETQVVDIRLICATCRDLPAMVESGEFRSDLFYRIRGAPIGLPPLRQREDIVELAEHLLEGLCPPPGRPPGLSRDCQSWLQTHPWPGNIRELKTSLHHALILADGRDTLEIEDFPDASTSTSDRLPRADEPPVSAEESEKRAVLRARDAAQGNISEMARRLGVARTTVYRMLKRHGLR